MATILKLIRRTEPDFERRGSENGTHTGTWLVEVDDYVPGIRVLGLAQGIASVDRVPKRGERFRWASGGETNTDTGSYALDFRVSPVFPEGEGSKLWRIQVTWRPPRPGNDELPGTLQMPPLARPPEYWIEYETIDKVKSKGFTTSPLTVQLLPGIANRVVYPTGTLQNLTNEAGEPFSRRTSVRLPIMVKQINVATDLVALQLNNEFEDSVNTTQWNCRGLQVLPHYGLFLSADTGPERFEEHWRFFRMQIRIAVGREEFYDRQPRVARQPINDVTFAPETNFDVAGVPKPLVPLKDGGVAADNVAQVQNTELNWLLHRPKEFNDEPLLRYV